MKITIVDIPENRVTFFGGSGKMLLPDATIVAKVLQNLPDA
jgi:putative transposon-encoded protein